MSQRLPATRLFPATHACYYLSGEDSDAVFETAELLLSDTDDDATKLRVDINELALIHDNLQPGLFGEVRCHAMVRNAGSARPNQIDQLEALAARPPAGLRLIICAPGIDKKKAVHKRISALPDVICCMLDRMDEAAFADWLRQLAGDSGLHLSEEALILMGAHLLGMRMAARQTMERLRLYNAGEDGEIDADIVGDLLGERSPKDLTELCKAVGERSPRALGLLRTLLREQHVAEVQVLSWVSMRLQQLLLFAWYERSDSRNAARNAGIFGAAAHEVPRQVKYWKPQQLMQAMAQMLEVEMLLKGASVEQKPVVLERFVAQLVSARDA